MGIQDCNAEGTGFGTCQCPTSGNTTSGTTTSTGTGMGGAGGNSGTCGDGIIEPSDHCNDPSSEFYCAVDCAKATTGTGGAGGACAGHVYYAGMYPAAGGTLAPSIWANLPNAGGLTSLDAGNAQCKALGIGADHVCDLTEIQAAVAANEALLATIPVGTTAWMERTTTVNVDGLTGAPCQAGSAGCVSSPPGAGGRCNDWQYNTHHIGDGEYYSWDTPGQGPTYHYDNDTIFDPNNPHVHVHVGSDFTCGGVSRSILCCYQSCM
jgi:hypothetical protein